MVRRELFEAACLLVGVFVSVWTVRSIAWMVYGGARDYLQLAALVLSLAVALCGGWLLITRAQSAR